MPIEDTNSGRLLSPMRQPSRAGMGAQQKQFRGGQKAFRDAQAALRAGQFEAALTAGQSCVDKATPLGD